MTDTPKPGPKYTTATDGLRCPLFFKSCYWPWRCGYKAMGVARCDHPDAPKAEPQNESR